MADIPNCWRTQMEKNTNIITSATETSIPSIEDTQAEIQAIKLERANKVSVKVLMEGYQADFYRTHKKLLTLTSDETGWEADPEANKSAQREDFRKYVTEHAHLYGIDWKPQDMRAEANRRLAKYESDEALKEDTVNMLSIDINNLIEKCPYGVTPLSIEADYIVPMYVTAKGVDLAKLGVIGGKYEKSGNWAWAEIELTVTITKGGELMYYTTKCQLVSGQLKKPHITQTSFNESIKESLKEVGLWEEPKADEPKAEDTKVEEVAEEVQTEDKPKKGRKSSKKADK